MKRIVLDDTPAEPSLVFGQTLLRGALGAVLFGQGAAKWFDHAAFTQLLSTGLDRLGLAGQMAIQDLDHVVHAISVVEMLAGVGLIFGWLTSLCAVTLMASSVLAAVFEYLRVQTSEYIGYELPLVLLASGAVLFLTGGGPVSVDNGLKQRAIRKAIQEDAIWGRHPYVSAPRRQEDATRSRGGRMAPRYR
jgi:uncharacterized membrane protein YphA (DoxX/SURF4 family)